MSDYAMDYMQKLRRFYCQFNGAIRRTRVISSDHRKPRIRGKRMQTQTDVYTRSATDPTYRFVFDQFVIYMLRDRRTETERRPCVVACAVNRLTHLGRARSGMFMRFGWKSKRKRVAVCGNLTLCSVACVCWVWFYLWHSACGECTCTTTTALDCRHDGRKITTTICICILSVCARTMRSHVVYTCLPILICKLTVRWAHFDVWGCVCVCASVCRTL